MTSCMLHILPILASTAYCKTVTLYPVIAINLISLFFKFLPLFFQRREEKDTPPADTLNQIALTSKERFKNTPDRDNKR